MGRFRKLALAQRESRQKRNYALFPQWIEPSSRKKSFICY